LSSNAQAVRGIRTGGRSARVRAAILAATLDELIDTGYAALTIDNIAMRAGVNRTTIYRRWNNREELVIDALADWVGRDIPIPDTGSVEGDLRALAVAVSDLLNSPLGRAVLGTVVATRNRIPELVDATIRFFDERHHRAAPIVERAIARGELPRDTDTIELFTALRAPLYYRVVTTGEQLDDTVVERAVDVVLSAARAGALSRRD
jgi:AcrR family transcriptional regulator